VLRVKDLDRTSAADAVSGGADGRAGEQDDQEEWSGEVRDLLRHANEQARALRGERRTLLDRVARLEKNLQAATAENAQLTARLRELERANRGQKGTPAGSNEQWLAGVADRSAHALRSSQEAARQLVERARQRAGEIEQAALRDAAEIRKRAETDAQRAVTVANYDAEGLLQGAQASSEELLAEARKVRDRAVAQFAERRAALQAEIDRLESRRVGLLETYAAMKPIVDEAIEILEGEPPREGHRPAWALRTWRRGTPSGEGVGGPSR
jgi:chromosome segregation ATPase